MQTESLGPAFEFTPEYGVFWAYVPHFIHSPFYVYAYAFGDCLVNALYAVFQSGHPGFQAKYLDMLRAGGTKRHKELLAPFGLDASDPAFWRKGLDVIAGFIDELEAIALDVRHRRPRPLVRRIAPHGPHLGRGRRHRRARGRRADVRHQDRPRRPMPRTCGSILGGLKGPLMKVAQFLSTVPDALPTEYAEELAQLQSNAPPMGWNFVRRRMASELGAAIGNAGSPPSAARPPPPPASARCIAHACRTAPRSPASCNIPTWPSTVEADLRQLRLAMAIYHRMDNAIQHEEIYKELSERLREELDYEREAAQMRLYRLMLARRARGARAGADRRAIAPAGCSP